MKRISLILGVVLLGLCASAQQLPKSFFDAKGNLRLETQELADNADTLVSVFHRSDDIVWDRVIYRIIDMRYKQNFQLYYPTHANHERYHNLLNVIAEAVVDGMPLYSAESNLNKGKINPDFSDSALLKPIQIPFMFLIQPPEQVAPDALYEEEAYRMFMSATASPAMIVLASDSSENAKLVPNYNNFELLVRNQLKYLIQEVVFFDKHTSRLYSKIIGIAPLYQRKIPVQDYETNVDYRTALLQSIMFWVSYDDLRPYLAKQYLIPTNNEAKRVTYEEFFQKRLYSSYIVAESNMYDRMILDYAVKPEEVAKEQERIASSLLTFEQDLWEY